MDNQRSGTLSSTPNFNSGGRRMTGSARTPKGQASLLAQYATLMNRFIQFISVDFLGGPRLLTQALVINTAKFLYVALGVGYLYYSENFTPGAFVFVALCGSYGVIWLMKHFAFRDPRWEQPITFGGALMTIVIVFIPYWTIGYLAISGAGAHQSLPFLALCVALHTLGVAVMIAADSQKYFSLKFKKGLIDTGMFRHVRHPNYLGEIMIYASYGLLANHWLAWSILAFVWLGVFLPFIVRKELSMARYPEWAGYVARSKALVPLVM
jgi:protein-S-isoprenylcysteine O-methyltransferase Ste14